jgi:hypothetical protein
MNCPLGKAVPKLRLRPTIAISLFVLTGGIGNEDFEHISDQNGLSSYFSKNLPDPWPASAPKSGHQTTVLTQLQSAIVSPTVG